MFGLAASSFGVRMRVRRGEAVKSCGAIAWPRFESIAQCAAVTANPSAMRVSVQMS
jgi:hypothetical protein